MRKEQPLNLSRLLFSSIITFLFSSLNTKQKVVFPVQIGEYKFKKQIRITKRNSKGSRMYSYALYQNPKRQKAFAKMWSGKLKDLNYSTLRNETILYTVLNGAIRRIGKSMPKKFEDIIIPQFITKLETENSLILLTKFIEIVPVPKMKSRRQFEIYLKSFDFLKFLGNKLLAGEKKQIAKRDAKTLIFLYFLLLLKASLIHPRAIFSLFKGVPVFLQSIPILLKKNKIGLCHRDLHLENIVISEHKVALLDLQFCLFSDPLHDRLTTLKMHWIDKEFRQKLSGEIRNLYGKNKDFDILVRGLMVHSATHSLSGNNFTKSITKNFIDYLNFATKPNFQI